MYYEHFGLTQAPFKITPNTDFFFTGGNRGPVLEALIYAITHGEGIVKVSGEVGSGKTMLCNMLQNRLADNVESVYLANPSVAPEEVLHAIAFELQLGVDRAADRLEVMHALQDYLVQQHAEGKRVVVFIEESQSMPLGTLEEIRLLSNLETRTDKLLQIVLFGQPELDEMLRRPDIRQLRDRIAHSFRLEPLTCAEVREYLTFRMRAAGYRGPEIFSTHVVKQIADASNGLTRRVNLIADKALLAAFSENTHTIQPKHVQAALRDSEFSPPVRRWKIPMPHAWVAVALMFGTVLGAVLFAAFGTRFDNHGASPIAALTGSVLPAERAVLPGVPPMTAGERQAPANAHVSPDVVSGPLLLSPRRGSQAREASAANSSETLHTRGDAHPGNDVIGRRLNATKRWLGGRSEDRYSIQLLVANSEEQLRNHLKDLPKFIEINDIYMYRGLGQGGARLNVLWGSYDTRTAALESLDELPPSLRANRPYVRTVESVRAEMERNSASR
ncbi:MAG: biosis protein MshM [Betaproteobacteria bacterium]|nr:biosis protein MshM [Betaproteobacteria bacterium]